MNKKDTDKRQSDDSINKQNDIQPLGDTNTEDNFPHLNDTELRDLILLQYGQSYLDSVWDSVNEACSLKYAISVYTNNTNNIDNRHNINNIDKIQNSENKNDQKYIKNNGVRNNIKKDQEQHIKKHSNNHTNKENDKTLNKDGPNKETTSNRLLTLYHQNIPYIKGKIDITEDMLQDLLPDITLITEHGLKKEENGILKIDGYNLVGTYNRNSHKSGGCALLVKKDLHCEYIDKYNSYGVDFHFEFTAEAEEGGSEKRKRRKKKKKKKEKEKKKKKKKKKKNKKKKKKKKEEVVEEEEIEEGGGGGGRSGKEGGREE
ncbi:hypothetical protein M8J75_008397 [Diaphorina citri]|nr:hypothetical protein M8J75_008397 [Diaphorina citri]